MFGHRKLSDALLKVFSLKNDFTFIGNGRGNVSLHKRQYI